MGEVSDLEKAVGLTETQKAALVIINRIADRLVHEHPEIADMYRDLENYGSQHAIAQEVIPDEVAHSEEIARGAVGLALKQLIPEDELVELRKEHRVQGATNYGHDLSSYGKKGAQERYKRHGFDAESLVAARGDVPRSPEEKAYTVELEELGFQQDPLYSYISGSHKGKPHAGKIADHVNSKFFGGAPVRNHSGTGIFLRRNRNGRQYWKKKR